MTFRLGSAATLLALGAFVGGCGDDPSPADAGPDGSTPDATMQDFGVGDHCTTVGSTRPCGTDVGACTPGTQTCGSDMTFGECDGAVGPRTETCNGMDDDCDGTDDNVAGAGAACGTDEGECSMGAMACVGTELVCTGGVTETTETCNNLDDDCDGTIDNGVRTSFWLDADNDTFGDSNVMMAACSQPVGYVTNDSDCNDACTGCFPGGTEVCDGNNNDCDASVDEGVATTYYQDADSDSRGNPNMSMTACSAPLGYVTNTNDCNDMCNLCWTGNPEVCDGLDNNCVGGVDEGVLTTFYRDADMDSRGNPAMSMMACTAPSGYVNNSNDCNDACNTCWTGNAESCDALDNNCSGVLDEGFACIQGSAQPCTTTCGTTGTGSCTAACLLPGPAVCTPPAETCNSIDEDCDTVVDEGVIARTTPGPTLVLGNDAKLANIAAGYVAVRRVAATTEAYRVDTAGEVRGTPDAFVTLEASNVVSVDIDRLSDTQWGVASTINGTGVQHRLLGLDGSGNPTVTHSRLVADTSANGVSRVANNSTAAGMVIYASGAVVRTAVMVALGNNTATSGTTLPGTQHRPELGMDVAPAGGTNFVITWVQGTTPQVHVALLSGTTVTSNAAVGAGSNPSLVRDASGNFGLVYTGSDNLPRFHHLTPTLTCLEGGGARTTCAQTLGALTVNAPAGGFVSHRTLDIAADGNTFWVSARVSSGEQLFRVSRLTTHDSVFRAINATVWMSVGAQGGRPLVPRGSTGYSHDTYGCP